MVFCECSFCCNELFTVGALIDPKPAFKKTGSDEIVLTSAGAFPNHDQRQLLARFSRTKGDS
jgi:hypothetical protein